MTLTDEDFRTIKHLFDDRFDRIDARFEQVDARLDRIDGRLDDHDARFDRITRLEHHLRPAA